MCFRLPGKTELATVLLTSNPWEERDLHRKLLQISKEKTRKGKLLEHSQRQFFINQIFDQELNLRFSKLDASLGDHSSEISSVAQNFPRKDVQLDNRKVHADQQDGKLPAIRKMSMGIFAPPVLVDPIKQNRKSKRLSHPPTGTLNIDKANYDPKNSSVFTFVIPTIESNRQKLPVLSEAVSSDIAESGPDEEGNEEKTINKGKARLAHKLFLTREATSPRSMLTIPEAVSPYSIQSCPEQVLPHSILTIPVSDVDSPFGTINHDKSQKRKTLQRRKMFHLPKVDKGVSTSQKQTGFGKITKSETYPELDDSDVVSASDEKEIGLEDDELCKEKVLTRLMRTLPGGLMVKANKNINKIILARKRQLKETSQKISRQDTLLDPRWQSLSNLLVKSDTSSI